MKLSDCLEREAVLPLVKVTCLKQAILKAASVASEHTGVPEQAIFNALQQREKLGTTAIGNASIVPHARLQQIDKIHCVFLRTQEPITCETPDNVPVEFIFVILVPQLDQSDPLKLLAKVTRILKDPIICEALHNAYTRDHLYQLIIQHDE